MVCLLGFSLLLVAAGGTAAEEKRGAKKTGKPEEGKPEEGKDRGSLKVALVQYEVELEDYSSPASFSKEVNRLLTRAASAEAEIAIFPEYINTFLSFVEEAEGLRGASDLEEGLKLLPSGNLHRILCRRSAEVRSMMDSLWGGAARRYGLVIVAGSYFACENGELYNRAVVYGSDGKEIYRQDKVKLTPYEKKYLRLSPGEVEEAELFDVDGWDCALTICRDTFFETWNGRLEDADLWMDLKANGEKYTDDTEDLFARALPERIAQTGVPYGITVCLNGRYLDLLWEGPSSIVRYAGAGNVEHLAAADKVDEGQVIFGELSPVSEETLP